MRLLPRMREESNPRPDKIDSAIATRGDYSTFNRIEDNAEYNLGKLDLTRVEEEDLDKYGDLDNILFRPGKAANTREEKNEVTRKLRYLSNNHGVNIHGSPEAFVHDSKTQGQRRIESKTWHLPNVKTPERYTEEQARGRLKKGHNIVLKQDYEGKAGNNIVLCSEEEELEEYIKEIDNFVAEEPIPKNKDGVKEFRSVLYNGKVLQTASKDNDDFRYNISKGGRYTGLRENLTKEEKQALESISIDGLCAVDYILEEGESEGDIEEMNILELNATPGTKIDDEYGGVTDVIAEELSPITDENELKAEILSSPNPDTPNYTQSNAQNTPSLTI